MLVISSLSAFVGSVQYYWSQPEPLLFDKVYESTVTLEQLFHVWSEP
ncbi:MAG: hypothetical protein ACI9NT_002232, partial [Bacteroidia bacterium]